MGTRALPDMYALSPRACGPRASGIHIRQSTHAHVITYTYICDRICKKGSYTRTTSEHRFHRIHYQTIHVCMFCCQHFISLLFLRLLSEPCQTSMNARFVLSRLCWLFNKGYQAMRSHMTL